MAKKNTINEARKPANKQVGQHLFKGLRYDNNGNPLYTCDTLSNEQAQAMGWRFSPKYGLYGQLSDPTMFYESKKNTIRLTESDLKKVISESVKRVLKEMDESYVINKLLSQTSDYLMKFDASDEARTCAQALENWTEYRASYILDCLNFACKHAYKCLNSDIDENPNTYLQVAFEARKMWREYMM